MIVSSYSKYPMTDNSKYLSSGSSKSSGSSSSSGSSDSTGSTGSSGSTSSTSSSSGSSSSSSTSTDSSKSLGKDEFLKLLVTQIKNQDPLNPMDNADFTAQMAQFSSLEQLLSVNDNLSSLLSASNSATSVQAMSLIGKEVTATGQNIRIKSGSASGMSFDLGTDASSVSISIEDENGNVVRTIDAGARNSGSQTISWDGKDSNGKQLEDGLYQYSVTAKDSDGGKVDVTTYSKGVVDSVTFEDGVAYLHIGDSKYMLSEITAVSEAKTSSSSSSSSSGSKTGSA